MPSEQRASCRAAEARGQSYSSGLAAAQPLSRALGRAWGWSGRGARLHGASSDGMCCGLTVAGWPQLQQQAPRRQAAPVCNSMTEGRVLSGRVLKGQRGHTPAHRHGRAALPALPQTPRTSLVSRGGPAPSRCTAGPWRHMQPALPTGRRLPAGASGGAGGHGKRVADAGRSSGSRSPILLKSSEQLTETPSKAAIADSGESSPHWTLQQ